MRRHPKGTHGVQLVMFCIGIYSLCLKLAVNVFLLLYSQQDMDFHVCVISERGIPSKHPRTYQNHTQLPFPPFTIYNSEVKLHLLD
jgi:hypothetical protein